MAVIEELNTSNELEVREAVRSVGLRVTSPRVRILQILEEAYKRREHMSAEDIYQALLHSSEDFGPATVYRVLSQFEAVGLVRRLHFEYERSVFELNRGKHHDHLVCLGCGKIMEFLDDLIEERQLKVARESGFTMTDHSLNIYGHCQTCSEQQEIQVDKIA